MVKREHQRTAGVPTQLLANVYYYYPVPRMHSEGSSDCSWTGYIIYMYIITPRAHARARGYVIGRGWWWCP